MIQGLHNSVSGAMVQNGRMRVISNNLANVNTNAFKKEFALFNSRAAEPYENPEVQFRSHMGKANLGGGIFMSDAFTDHTTPGSLTQTYDNMDLRIQDSVNNEGSGFFRLEQNESKEVFYKRGGHFIVNEEGFLTDESGEYIVIDTRGNKVKIPENTDLKFDGKGQILLNGEVTETIKMVDFDQKDLPWMKKVGDNLLQPIRPLEEKAFTGTVMIGSIEGSNVKMHEEMVEMIQAQRNYDLNMKMLTMQDTTLDRAISQVGNIQV